MKIRVTLVACLLALAGCASLAIEKPVGLKQQIAFAEGQHSAIQDAVDSSVNAHTISSAQAAYIISKNDEIQPVLVAAKDAFIAGDMSGAQSHLAIALTAITALQDYLRAQQGTKP